MNLSEMGFVAESIIMMDKPGSKDDTHESWVGSLRQIHKAVTDTWYMGEFSLTFLCCL